MSDFDVFNGDADGICALHMLRIAEPRSATLITGVKRDIALLRRVRAGADDRVAVLDISLDRNRSELDRMLGEGAKVEYFDHHYAGEIPVHAGLCCHIDTAPSVCTGLIVNHHLRGRYGMWAVVAAFGDNLGDTARTLGASLGLEHYQLAQLNSLGECLNYNGYGESLADLYYAPDELYLRVHAYESPFDMIRHDASYTRLRNGFDEDMEKVEAMSPTVETPTGAVFVLPCEPSSRRISGVFGNALSNRFKDRAHAVLTEKEGGGYVVSVRAPASRKTGADDLCRQFETGGGRKAAAGINYLPESEFDRFLRSFHEAY